MCELGSNLIRPGTTLVSKDDRVVLTPASIDRNEAVHSKLYELVLTESDIADAVLGI